MKTFKMTCIENTVEIKTTRLIQKMLKFIF